MRLVQISDTHVFADKNATLLNLNTWQSCAAVIRLIAAHPRLPDAIILTGDISQDYSAPAYQQVAALCQPFTCPVYWLPGNHDEPAIMQHTFAHTALKPDKLIHWQQWTCILLNSHYPGKAYGQLASTQLAWLTQQLVKYAHQHIFIFLHHHPLLIGSAWLDQSILQNADAFFAITDQFSHIRGIICGHVHQVFETVRRGVPIMSAPSTSLQFLPNSKTFALDEAYPGYRWFELQAEGRFQTGVERVTDFANTVDFAASGY